MQNQNKFVGMSQKDLGCLLEIKLAKMNAAVQKMKDAVAQIKTKDIFVEGPMGRK